MWMFFLLEDITEEIYHPPAFGILSSGENLDPPCRIGIGTALVALLRCKHSFWRGFWWVH